MKNKGFMEEQKTEQTKVTCTLLPEKLSDIILVALADLEKCEKDKEHYLIDMGEWAVKRRGICEVCFAGAWLMQTAKVRPSDREYDMILHLDPRLIRIARALDYARSGFLQSALGKYIGGVYDARLNDIRILNVRYDVDPVVFKKNIRIIAEMLAKLGY